MKPISLKASVGAKITQTLRNGTVIIYRMIREKGLKTIRITLNGEEIVNQSLWSLINRRARRNYYISNFAINKEKTNTVYDEISIDCSK